MCIRDRTGRNALGEPGFATGEQHDFVRRDELIFKLFVFGFAGNERHIEFAAEQFAFQLVIWQGNGLHAYFGINRLEFGEHLRQKFVRTLLGQTETQKPRGVAGERGDRLVHLRFDLQKAARGLHVDLPGGRERNGRGAPLEDGRAELLLDLPNLLGERRLGDDCLLYTSDAADDV